LACPFSSCALLRVLFRARLRLRSSSAMSTLLGS
jgi:hypothetical protein